MDAATLAKHIIELPPHTGFLEHAEKQLTPKILAQLVVLLRQHAVVPPRLQQARQQWSSTLVDVCGTGGSKTSRLNTSTLVAMFAPDLGFSVIKHGGRSASGKVGSLDLLEKLGLDVPFLYEHAAECLRATGLCYLGAGLTYAPFARYSATRKIYGQPSIFNVLGPLLNPAKPNSRLLGAYQKSVAQLLAETLLELGEEALVVCSEDDEGTLDEASPYGTTYAYDVTSGTLTTHVVPPAEKISGKRTGLFADGVQAALDFLEGTQNSQAQAALHFVAYNLACLAALKAPPKARNEFTQTLHSTYCQIQETFGARLKRAQTRLQTLRNLSPVHEHSPTRLGCKVLEEHTPVVAQAHLPQPFKAFSTGDQNKEIPGVAISSRTKTNTSNDASGDGERGVFEMSRGILFAEIKIRTPLKTFESPLALEERIAAYALADAISVVTHPQFGGSLALLARVRSLTQKPLLAKDFVCKSSEVERLVAAGADGILLLEDMVTAEELERLVATCLHCQATPFVESSWKVPDLAGLKQRNGRGAEKMQAVFNARNLFSLEEGRRYRDEAARTGVPEFPCILASSLSEPAEIFLALQEHAGVIVGSALMKLHDPQKIKDFLERCTRVRPLLKTCGARSLRDVEDALENGADFVGINLIPTSKRYATPEFVKVLANAPQNLHKHLVYVTSPTSPAQMLALCGDMNVYEQPYGAPLLAHRRGFFAPHSPATPSIGALAQTTDALRISAGALVVVLDSAVPGSGHAENYSTNSAHKSVPVLAAGGVNPDNVLQRFEEAAHKGWNVAGVDVASGIEKPSPSTEFGGFEKERIRALVSALGSASCSGGR